MDYVLFKTHLQYLIIRGLKSKKRNITVKEKFLISSKLYSKLKGMGVTGRFKTNGHLLASLQLELRRYSGCNGYCQCMPETFRLRIGRQATLRSSDGKESKKYQSGAYIFSFEFIRYELVDV